MNTPCSFTSEDDHPLFLEICEKLQPANLGLSKRKLHVIWLRAYKHFVCMLDFCPRFCEKFGPNDVINVASPATSFYTVALVKIDWQPETDFPGQLARNNSNLMTHKMSKDKVIAFNAFINAMIKDQKDDPVARLAVA